MDIEQSIGGVTSSLAMKAFNSEHVEIIATSADDAGSGCSTVRLRFSGPNVVALREALTELVL